MLLTRNLKSLLKSYEGSLPTEQFQSFKNYLESLILKTVDELKTLTPGPVRGRRVHQLLEAEIQKASSVKSTCRAGCAACCHFEVEITSDEADILAELVTSGAAKIDRPALFAQAARGKQDPQWGKGPTPENKCVFLTPMKTCGIYESRPSSCRRLLVTTDPGECHSADGSPIPVAIPLAEVVLSSAISVEGNSFGPLAQMLGIRIGSTPLVAPGAATIEKTPRSLDL
jgi:Fe-S-cluster containining protein